DLYWLPLWDTVPPVEEVLATLDALVRSGKILAFGLSNVPAWDAARAQVLADARGWEAIGGPPLEHPLGSGSVSGKSTGGDDGVVADGRIAAFGGSVPGRPYGDREWRILDVLR